jgi:hypothetical protein
MSQVYAAGSGRTPRRWWQPGLCGLSPPGSVSLHRSIGSRNRALAALAPGARCAVSSLRGTAN